MLSLSSRVWWGLVGCTAAAVVMSALVAWVATHHLLVREVDQQLAEPLAQSETKRMPPPHRFGTLRPNRLGRFHVRMIVAETGSEVFRTEEWPDQLSTIRVNELQTIHLDDGQIFRLGQVTFTPRPGRRRGPDHHRAEGERDRRQGGDDRPSPDPVMLTVAINMTDLYKDLRRLALLLAIVAAAVIGVAMIVARYVRRSVLRPVYAVGEAIVSLPPEDPDARLVVDGLPQELTHITDRLDELLDRLAAVRERERRTTADIAHELRTPLAALRSELEFAAQAGEVPQTKATTMARQITVMQERSDQLLLLSRLESGHQLLHAESISAAELIYDAWNTLSTRAQEKNIDFSVQGESVELQGDRPLLAMIFANVLGNAVAHGDGNDQLRVVVRSSEDSMGLTRIRVSNGASRLAPGDKDEVFHPFWRDDEARSDVASHSGLGLALVRRIAEAHGGSTTAQVTDDGLFEIVILLPKVALGA